MHEKVGLEVSTIEDALPATWLPEQLKWGDLWLQEKLKDALASATQHRQIHLALESQQKQDQKAIENLQGQLHAAILDAQRTATEYAVCKCRAGALQ